MAIKNIAQIKFGIKSMRNLISLSIFAIIISLPKAALSVTVLLGDMDSFGFSGSLSGLTAADGGAVDGNGDGVLSPSSTCMTNLTGRNGCDFLPDLNLSGDVGTGSGDDFDNRSISEITDANLKWTDVSLSSTFISGPGVSNDVVFTFSFSPPSPGDSDFGVDHVLELVAGDFTFGEVEVAIDGIQTPFNGVGTGDGLIRLHSALVPFSALIDGELVVEIVAIDPYIAIDYVQLNSLESPPQSVPEPSNVLGLGAVVLIGALFRKRKQTKDNAEETDN